MQVIYHLGVHCTDERRLERCLWRNAQALAGESIVIPDPEVYKPVLRNVVNAMRGARSSRETEETVLDAVMVVDEAARLVFSNEAFLCVRPHVLARGTLYAGAAQKAVALANLLPSHETELAFALRNPATFLPALYQSTKVASFDEFIAGTDPMTLSWADMVGRIRAALPDLRMTIWCDEDTPLIWPEVLRAVAGCRPATTLEGEGELAASLMSAEGNARMADYLAARPQLSAEQRRKAIVAFLDRYAVEERIEIELDLPGWDADYVDRLTARYDADVAEVAAIAGVRFLTPWSADPDRSGAGSQAMPRAAL